jgi:hypothetical protein
MWTAAEVMSRFVEAADTERRTPSKGMQQARTCWPAYGYSTEDREGWTDDNKAEEQNRWADTKGAKADAVSRYDECVEWGITYIVATKTRDIVWTWAFCQAISGRSFKKECHRKGWVRATAYRRLYATFDAISFNLNNERILLRPAALQWVRQQSPSIVDVCSTVGNSASAAIPFTSSFQIEPSTDLPEIRDLSWAERRWEREAKRRAKMKLDDAA